MPKRWQRRKKKLEKAILDQAATLDPSFKEKLAEAKPEDVQRILDEVLWGKRK
jgi:hypothetical protein